MCFVFFFFFQAEDGIRDGRVTGVQTCALPISWDGHYAAIAVHQPEHKLVGLVGFSPSDLDKRSDGVWGRKRAGNGPACSHQVRHTSGGILRSLVAQDQRSTHQAAPQATGTAPRATIGCTGAAVRKTTAGMVAVLFGRSRPLASIETGGVVSGASTGVRSSNSSTNATLSPK